jgi:hypothetical protein
MQVPSGFAVNRALADSEYLLEEVFTGLEESPVLLEKFGGKEAVKKFLTTVKVQLVDSSRGYMRVDDSAGTVHANSHYVRTGPLVSLYLDINHELIHVIQFRNGRKLFDNRYAYVDRPTELEAYLPIVEEARRIGMSEDEICDYLRVEWVTEEDFGRLLTNLGVSARDGPP